ncbi:hypothetical protein AC630_13270 [Bradyrhizobium sp. AS23.2]|nr:hypothetical protein AC630_13270 [Bradyrhizobium sp. AS23.2]
MTELVVADDRRERNLVKNSGAAIALGNIPLVEDVATIDVAPYAGAGVVMYVIVAQDDALADRQLDAAGLPAGQEFTGVVFPDVVPLDHDIPADPGDPNLTVVVNVAVAHAGARSGCDARGAVQPQLAILDVPAVGLLRLDRSLLGHTGVFLDC